ncbi:MAG: endonuclease/exonuclease/phosphatase family protein [Candidatus Doudnabacteria bacterium]
MNNNTPEFTNSISLFCWNIANPSLKRAASQANWLHKLNKDILVLTECKNSEGSRFIEKYLLFNGYEVIFPRPDNNGYGVLVASKLKTKITLFANSVPFLNSRIVSISIELPSLDDFIEIIGLYIPSRDVSSEKIIRKRTFLQNVISAFNNSPNYKYRVFCGDFNILEPNHFPHYSFFQDWEYGFYNALNGYELIDAYRYLHPTEQEYSWVGRTGDGYRYDHFFVSKALTQSIKKCFYLHDPRNEKLSDHSAIISELGF